MHLTPDDLEAEFSLPTAATRLDFLSRRDDGTSTLNSVYDGAAGDADGDDWTAMRAVGTSLDVHEALELLALGEVIARKAHDSQLVGIRAALRNGAGWEEIAAALGVTQEQAWDAFAESISRKLEPGAADAVRQLAGARPAS
jgi:alkylhydroperoxidase/carboxymuconolactone decarboxylase family protein YurZ